MHNGCDVKRVKLKCAVILFKCKILKTMQDSHNTDIGPLIRSRRKDLAFSLRDLAERTGLTHGFLGQIERGESSPSIETFLRIANALKAPITYFISNDRPVDEADPRQVDAVLQQRLSSDAIHYEMLSRDFSNKMELFRARMRPGAAWTCRDLGQPTEQVVYVLEGRLKITLSSGQQIVDASGFHYFDGDSLRGLEAVGHGETVWISVITPPVAS